MSAPETIVGVKKALEKAQQQRKISQGQDQEQCSTLFDKIISNHLTDHHFINGLVSGEKISAFNYEDNHKFVKKCPLFTIHKTYSLDSGHMAKVVARYNTVVIEIKP